MDAERRGPLRHAGRAAAVVVAALFVALLVYGVVRKSPDTGIDESLAKSHAPAAPGFDLPVLLEPAPADRAFADGRLALSELRGRPVVLNFWASWCVPCREEAPVLERAWRGARRTRLVFLGVNMQDISDDARAFASRFGISYGTARDRGDGVAHDYGVTGLPETFFIDRRGRVVAHVIGVVSAGQLRDGVRAARRGLPLGVESGGERRSTR